MYHLSHLGRDEAQSRMLNPLPESLARLADACLVTLPLLAFASGCLDPMVKEVFVDGNDGTSRRGGPGGLGELCVPSDDDFPDFANFSIGEVNIETEYAECRSRICMVDHFQGRVTCPEGNQDGDVCLTPLGEVVTASVLPQLPERPAEDAVFCSCRCDGPRGAGPFCECPGDMMCEERIAVRGTEDLDVAGSYCVKRQ